MLTFLSRWYWCSSCCCYFEAWWWEVLLQRGSHFEFSRLALIDLNTTQAIRREILFHHKFLIDSLNLHITTHVHCFDILHLKHITFLRILAIFNEDKFLFWAPHSLTITVFFITTLASHGTFSLMDFSWSKLSFWTCKFWGYYLTQYETSIRSTKFCVKLRKQKCYYLVIKFYEFMYTNDY